MHTNPRVCSRCIEWDPSLHQEHLKRGCVQNNATHFEPSLCGVFAAKAKLGLKSPEERRKICRMMLLMKFFSDGKEVNSFDGMIIIMTV